MLVMSNNTRMVMEKHINYLFFKGKQKSKGVLLIPLNFKLNTQLIDLDNKRIIVVSSLYRNYNWKKIVHSVIKG